MLAGLLRLQSERDAMIREDQAGRRIRYHTKKYEERKAMIREDLEARVSPINRRPIPIDSVAHSEAQRFGGFAQWRGGTLSDYTMRDIGRLRPGDIRRAWANQRTKNLVKGIWEAGDREAAETRKRVQAKWRARRKSILAGRREMAKWDRDAIAALLAPDEDDYFGSHLTITTGKRGREDVEDNTALKSAKNDLSGRTGIWWRGRWYPIGSPGYRRAKLAQYNALSSYNAGPTVQVEPANPAPTPAVAVEAPPIQVVEVEAPLLQPIIDVVPGLINPTNVGSNIVPAQSLYEQQKEAAKKSRQSPFSFFRKRK